MWNAVLSTPAMGKQWRTQSQRQPLAPVPLEAAPVPPHSGPSCGRPLLCGARAFPSPMVAIADGDKADAVALRDHIGATADSMWPELRFGREGHVPRTTPSEASSRPRTFAHHDAKVRCGAYVSLLPAATAARCICGPDVPLTQVTATVAIAATDAPHAALPAADAIVEAAGGQLRLVGYDVRLGARLPLYGFLIDDGERVALWARMLRRRLDALLASTVARDTKGDTSDAQSPEPSEPHLGAHMSDRGSAALSMEYTKLAAELARDLDVAHVATSSLGLVAVMERCGRCRVLAPRNLVGGRGVDLVPIACQEFPSTPCLSDVPNLAHDPALAISPDGSTVWLVIDAAAFAWHVPSHTVTVFGDFATAAVSFDTAHAVPYSAAREQRLYVTTVRSSQDSHTKYPTRLAFPTPHHVSNTTAAEVIAVVRPPVPEDEEVAGTSPSPSSQRLASSVFESFAGKESDSNLSALTDATGGRHSAAPQAPLYKDDIGSGSGVLLKGRAVELGGPSVHFRTLSPSVVVVELTTDSALIVQAVRGATLEKRLALELEAFVGPQRPATVCVWQRLALTAGGASSSAGSRAALSLTHSIAPRDADGREVEGGPLLTATVSEKGKAGLVHVAVHQLPPSGAPAVLRGTFRPSAAPDAAVYCDAGRWLNSAAKGAAVLLLSRRCSTRLLRRQNPVLQNTRRDEAHLTLLLKTVALDAATTAAPAPPAHRFVQVGYAFARGPDSEVPVLHEMSALANEVVCANVPAPVVSSGSFSSMPGGSAASTAHSNTPAHVADATAFRLSVVPVYGEDGPCVQCVFWGDLMHPSAHANLQAPAAEGSRDTAWWALEIARLRAAAEVQLASTHNAVSVALPVAFTKAPGSTCPPEHVLRAVGDLKAFH